MPYTREDVLREVVEYFWRKPSREMVAAGYMPEGGLAGLTFEQRLQMLALKDRIIDLGFEPGLTFSQRLERLASREGLAGKTVYQLLEGIIREGVTPEVREQLHLLLAEPTTESKGKAPELLSRVPPPRPESGNQPLPPPV